MCRKIAAAIVFVLLFCQQLTCLAERRLPAIIADNMVLQHGQPLPIWGWAEPGETVEVSIAGETASAKSGSDGRWQVTLPKLAVSREPLEMRVRAMARRWSFRAQK